MLIHILTFFSGIEISMGKVFFMHIFAMLVFASIFIYYKKFAIHRKGKYNIYQRFNTFFRILKAIPRSALAIGGIFFIYAFINFSIFFVLMEGGSPDAKNGSYYLHNHGKKIRDLTQDEYKRFQAYEVRGFSGHWIIFSLVPTIFHFNKETILNAIENTDEDSR